ncbi:MAG: hypothetical protein K6G07_01605 [Lachnospiraceae bacterium]|nr:hypothetical protein [Lachnospiraceae bacterium]
MTGLEIILLILGVVIFIASFIIPEQMGGDKDATDVSVSGEMIDAMIDEKMKDAKSTLKDTVDETVNYAVEKSERSLERLSNEKIAAVSEFSETVMSDIHQSHQEVLFLYDMLHDKQKNLHDTVIEADKAEAAVKEAQIELEYKAKESVKQEEAKPAPEPEPEPIKEPAQELAEQFQAIPLSQYPTAQEGAKVIEPVPVVENIVSTGDNQNDEILRLHRAGRSNVAIAKQLGLGVGEVKLVIDLFEVG